MDENSRIFVAGHKGLLGSALMRLLQVQGFRNILTRSRGELDLRDRRAVDIFFETFRPEYVFMAAGKTGGVKYNIEHSVRLMNDNLRVQDGVINAAGLSPHTKRLIFIASSCMYPLEAPQPYKEEFVMAGPIESTSAPYASAKNAGMHLCRSYNRELGKEFITVLPNTMYGPNDHFDLESSHFISGMMRRLHEAKMRGDKSITLFGTGRPVREALHVDDVAEALLLLMSQEKLSYDFFNIGSGVGQSIYVFAGMLKSVVGFPGDILWDSTKPDGAPKKIVDPSRIFSLGWRPKTDLLNGLANTYDWFLRNIR